MNLSINLCIFNILYMTLLLTSILVAVKVPSTRFWGICPFILSYLLGYLHSPHFLFGLVICLCYFISFPQTYLLSTLIFAYLYILIATGN